MDTTIGVREDPTQWKDSSYFGPVLGVREDIAEEGRNESNHAVAETVEENAIGEAAGTEDQDIDVSMITRQIFRESAEMRLERIERAEEKKEGFKTRREIRKIVEELVDKAALVTGIVRNVIREVISKAVTEVEIVKPVIEEILRSTEKKVRICRKR